MAKFVKVVKNTSKIQQTKQKSIKKVEAKKKKKLINFKKDDDNENKLSSVGALLLIKNINKPNLNVDENNVKVAIEALFKCMKEAKSKKLFDDEFPIFIQINCIKIPQCPARKIRLHLEHSLATEESEICLLVPDLKRGRRVDHEPTIEHYENKLCQNDVTNIKRIIPFHQIKVEYDQYELKRRLLGQYDFFLADSTISSHISRYLGKTFYESHKLPVPVHLNRSNIKENIEKALLKTSLFIHSYGDTHSVQIGHSKMPVSEITDNVMAIVYNLAREFPGGWENIRSLHVKTNSSIAVPIYLSLKSRNEIPVPKIQAKRPKKSGDVEGELTTKMNANVTVSAGGDISIRYNKKINK